MRGCWLHWLVAAAVVGAMPAAASSRFDLTSDFVSDYVFRGANQRQGASIQTSLSYGLYDTLTASLWTNLRLEGAMALSETDYDLRWTYLSASRAKFTVGATYFDRNSALLGRETAEAYAGVEMHIPGRPSLYLYYDWLRNPGLYAEASVGHRFLLPGYKGTVDLSAAVGLDSGRTNGFQAGRLSVSVTRLLGDWRISPGVDLWFPSNAVEPTVHSFQPVFRFTASRSF
ncbi:MAG: hypothetical protein HZB16_02410 [Armatimonadetes bacterium]|nr:hypothetical protein [Armatimonadota bacterium]